jgi:hypothetical protein
MSMAALALWPGSEAGAQSPQFYPPITIGTVGNGQVNPPTGGIAVDPAGNVYVLDQFNNQVFELPRGSSSGVLLPFSGLNAPEGIAVDAEGDVFVADTGHNRVMELAHGAATATQVELLSAVIAPSAIAVNANATELFVAYQGTGRAAVLAQINSNFKYSIADVLSSVTPAPGGISLALTPSGNLYVADSINNRILEVPSGFGVPITVATNVGPVPPGLLVGQIDAIAVDPSGDIFAGIGQAAIAELPVGTGSWVQIAGTQFTMYYGNLAVDVAGNVYALIDPGPDGSTSSVVVEYPTVLPVGPMATDSSSGAEGSIISATSESACPAPYTTGVELFLQNSSGAVVVSAAANLLTSSNYWAGTLTVPLTVPRGAYFVTAQCRNGGLDLQNTNLVPYTVMGINTAADLRVSPNPSVTGQKVTLVADLVPSAGTGAPTGTMTFSPRTVQWSPRFRSPVARPHTRPPSRPDPNP